MPAQIPTPDSPGRARSVFARFAVPHTFTPDLSFGEALVAIGGTLARIFGGCLLFSLWGALCVVTWDAIASRFWRGAAMLALLLMFPLALFLVMGAIARAERALAPRRAPK